MRGLFDRLEADGPEPARRRRVLAGALVVAALLGSNAWGPADAGTGSVVWFGTADLLQCAALIATAFLLVWRSRWVVWAGAVSVALVLLGVWFDVMTVEGGGASYAALAVSLLIKLPAVVVLVALVGRGRRW